MKKLMLLFLLLGCETSKRIDFEKCEARYHFLREYDVQFRWPRKEDNGGSGYPRLRTADDRELELQMQMAGCGEWYKWATTPIWIPVESHTPTPTPTPEEAIWSGMIIGSPTPTYTHSPWPTPFGKDIP